MPELRLDSARIVVDVLAIGAAWLLMDRFVLRPIEQRTTMRRGLVRDGRDCLAPRRERPIRHGSSDVSVAEHASVT
jgi:hypothetical protein